MRGAARVLSATRLIDVTGTGAVSGKRKEEEEKGEEEKGEEEKGTFYFCSFSL